MSYYTVLICDDREAVHESLGFFLEKEGIRVLSAYNGETALELFSAHPVDLLILDVMLPKMDGMEVCQIIRKTSDAPILFLSARSEEADRIRGLEIGGDDYVTKPFSAREVALRVRKQLQRRIPAAERTERELRRLREESGQGLPGPDLSDPGSHGAAKSPTEVNLRDPRNNALPFHGDVPENDLYAKQNPKAAAKDISLLRFEELSLNEETLEVFVNGRKIEMTAREVQFLAYLMHNPNRVLNREQILNAVWGYEYYGETRAVDAVVKRVRKKLAMNNVHFSISSIYGVGYRLGRAE